MGARIFNGRTVTEWRTRARMPAPPPHVSVQPDTMGHRRHIPTALTTGVPSLRALLATIPASCPGLAPSGVFDFHTNSGSKVPGSGAWKRKRASFGALHSQPTNSVSSLARSTLAPCCVLVATVSLRCCSSAACWASSDTCCFRWCRAFAALSSLLAASVAALAAAASPVAAAWPSMALSSCMDWADRALAAVSTLLMMACMCAMASACM